MKFLSLQRTNKMEEIARIRAEFKHDQSLKKIIIKYGEEKVKLVFDESFSQQNYSALFNFYEDKEYNKFCYDNILSKLKNYGFTTFQSFYKNFDTIYLIDVTKKIKSKTTKKFCDFIHNTALKYACRYNRLDFIKFLFTEYFDNGYAYPFLAELCFAYCIFSTSIEIYNYFEYKFSNTKINKKSCTLEYIHMKQHLYNYDVNFEVVKKIVKNHMYIKYMDPFFYNTQETSRKHEYLYFVWYMNKTKLNKNIIEIIKQFLHKNNYLVLNYIYKTKLIERDIFRKTIIDEIEYEDQNLEYYSYDYYMYLFLSKIFNHAKNNRIKVLEKFHNLLKRNLAKKLIELWFHPIGLGGIRAKVEIAESLWR